MAEVNVMEEAQAQASEWQEQKEQANRDFIYVSGKIDGLQEFMTRLAERAQEDKEGQDAEASTQPKKARRTKASAKK